MKIRNTALPTDPDQLGSLAAIKRAALRARELARQMNTPCYVMRNGRIVDVSLENLSVTNPDKSSSVRT